MSKKPIDIREFKGVDIVKHVGNPESYLLWSKERAAAKTGAIAPSLCPHPMNAVEQFVDEEPGRAGRPTNLFQCTNCHRLLRLVDAFGKDATDG